MDQLSTKIQIYKQHVVKRVAVEGTNVVVFGECDGKEFSKSCSYLVVTVPLGVLKSNLVLYLYKLYLPYKISFDPPLPESKQSAIARMPVICRDNASLVKGDSSTHFKGFATSWVQGHHKTANLASRKNAARKQRFISFLKSTICK